MNWYGFLIGSAMVLCIVLAYFIGKKRGYYSDLVFDIAIICLPLAIVGARLYYVLFDWIANPSEWDFGRIFRVWEGGLAVYGGLIGAIIGAVILRFVMKKRKDESKKVTLMQMCDLAFTLVFLGQAIGRWGNFANQEAFGNALPEGSPWAFFPFAVFIDSTNMWHQATFFYEFLLDMFGFVVLMCFYLGKRKSFDGFNFSMYCIIYGIGRFFIESLRTDSLWLIPDIIRVSQVVSIIALVFGVSFIIYHLYIARAKGMKPFILVRQELLDESYLGFAESILSHPPVAEAVEDIDSDLMTGYNGEGYQPDNLEDMTDIIGDESQDTADIIGDEMADIASNEDIIGSETTSEGEADKTAETDANIDIERGEK